MELEVEERIISRCTAIRDIRFLFIPSSVHKELSTIWHRNGIDMKSNIVFLEFETLCYEIYQRRDYDVRMSKWHSYIHNLMQYLQLSISLSMAIWAHLNEFRFHWTLNVSAWIRLETQQRLQHCCGIVNGIISYTYRRMQKLEWGNRMAFGSTSMNNL